MGNIGIIGLGNEGSNLAVALARNGHVLTLVDFDKIEHKNLSSQVYTNKYIRRSKDEIISTYLNNPHLHTYKHLKLENISDYKAFEDCAVIFNCTDNMKSRYLLADYANNSNLDQLFCDIRSAGMESTIVNFWNHEVNYYKTTLYTDDVATDTAPCGTRNKAHYNLLRAAYLANWLDQPVKKWMHQIFTITGNSLLEVITIKERG